MLKKYWDSFDTHLKELFKGASIAFLLKIIAAGCAFSLNIILARLLGVDGFGIYNLAFTVVFIVAAIGRVGMENALVRFIASNMSIKKYGLVLGVYQLAIKYSLLVALLLTLLMLLFSRSISVVLFSKPELESMLTILSLSIIPLALLTLHASALQGMKKIAESVSVLSIFVPFLASITAIVAVPYFGIIASAWSYLLATLVTLIIGRIFWVRATNKINTKPFFDNKMLFSSSMPLLFGVIMNMIIMWSPMLLLGVWETNENVGIFSAANRTAVLTSFILIAVNSIAAPKFAALYKQGNIIGLGIVARESGKIMMILALPIVTIFVIFPEVILSAFGDEFKKGAIVLVILSIGQYVNVATGSVGFLLMMTGNERLMRNNLIFCMLVELALCLVLIPDYGIVGAAIAASTVLMLQNLIAMILVKKKLGIMTLPFFK